MDPTIEIEGAAGVQQGIPEADASDRDGSGVGISLRNRQRADQTECGLRQHPEGGEGEGGGALVQKVGAATPCKR